MDSPGMRRQPKSDPLLQRLQTALYRGEETPGPEWKTSIQWAKEWDKSRSWSLGLLRAGVDGGLMEEKRFRVRVRSRVFLSPHYREKI